jgi:hypothetical protein
VVYSLEARESPGLIVLITAGHKLNGTNFGRCEILFVLTIGTTLGVLQLDGPLVRAIFKLEVAVLSRAVGTICGTSFMVAWILKAARTLMVGRLMTMVGTAGMNCSLMINISKLAILTVK